MAIVKITAKGRLTIPIDLRRKLRIRKHDHLLVEVEGNILKIQKLGKEGSLVSDDPIWDLVGRYASGKKDGSVQHDRYLTKGERQRWGTRSQVPADPVRAFRGSGKKELVKQLLKERSQDRQRKNAACK
jgi:AbrB family looped-hinge helix DNA binding protein